MSRTSLAAAVALAVLGAGCAEESLVIAGSGSATTIVAMGGDDQTARAGETLPDPLVIQVRDPQGNAVSGVEVLWNAEGGGAVSDPTTMTDGEGRSAVEWRLGDEPGVQRTIARLGADDGVRWTFTASALPQGSPRLVLVTQPPETAVSGEPLAEAPVVQLRSEDGDDLSQSGVSVTVAIASGGGELEGTRTRSTNDEGRITFSGLTIEGDAGTRRLIFAASGIASVTSREIDVSTPPPPHPGSIRIERGNNQTADVGQVVATDPAVKVLDASGAAKPGVTVTFSVASGGGSISGASATSDGEGIARLGEWRLGDAGTNTLRATASGYDGSPLTFTATAVTPPPPPPTAIRLRFDVQPTDEEEDERIRPPIRVSIVDAAGNIVTSADHRVRLAIIQLRGSGTLTGRTEEDAENGVATFEDVRVSRKGEYRLRASASGLVDAVSDPFEIEDD